jgi:transketolase
MPTAFDQTVPASLRQRCRSIQLRFLKMYYQAGAGHVGASLSCAEILTFLRFAWMKPEDEFLLSKGHAAAALYSVLAENHQISEESLSTFYQDGTLLAAHPSPSSVPGIRFATGSLGHGLSLCAGLALANQVGNQPGDVYCVSSDGELNEGSVWEALLFSAHHKLHNLRLLVDRNQIQGFGRTEDVMKLEPLSSKLAAFGWSVLEADGHCFESLENAKRQASDLPQDRPIAIICHTVKGKLLDLENTVDCHYLPMSPEAYNQIVERILADESPSHA